MNWDPAISIVETHKSELGQYSVARADDYIADLKAGAEQLRNRTPEDRRLAAQMSVDMSKTFVQIALAGLAAFVTFTQISSRPELKSLRFFLFAITAIFFMASIYCGSLAGSRIWQRGEGRLEPSGEPWSTSSIKVFLNLQAMTGAAAIVLLACLVIFGHEPSPLRGFRVSLPEGSYFITSGDIVINGQWKSLAIVDKKTQLQWHLPATTSDVDDSLSIAPN
jgi:hypothetical protein